MQEVMIQVALIQGDYSLSFVYFLTVFYEFEAAQLIHLSIHLLALLSIYTLLVIFHGIQYYSVSMLSIFFISFTFFTSFPYFYYYYDYPFSKFN